MIRRPYGSAPHETVVRNARDSSPIVFEDANTSRVGQQGAWHERKHGALSNHELTADLLDAVQSSTALAPALHGGSTPPNPPTLPVMG